MSPRLPLLKPVPSTMLMPCSGIGADFGNRVLLVRERRRTTSYHSFSSSLSSAAMSNPFSPMPSSVLPRPPRTQDLLLYLLLLRLHLAAWSNSPEGRSPSCRSCCRTRSNPPSLFPFPVPLPLPSPSNPIFPLTFGGSSVPHFAAICPCPPHLWQCTPPFLSACSSSAPSSSHGDDSLLGRLVLLKVVRILQDGVSQL